MDYESGRMLWPQREGHQYPRQHYQGHDGSADSGGRGPGSLTLDQPVTAPSWSTIWIPPAALPTSRRDEGADGGAAAVLHDAGVRQQGPASWRETVSGLRTPLWPLMNAGPGAGLHRHPLRQPQRAPRSQPLFHRLGYLSDYREAMKNETFMKICGTAAYVVPATNKSEAGELYTTNSLISNWRIMGYQYDGADGIKTGSTEGPAVPAVHRQAQRPPPGGGGAGLQGQHHGGKLL